MKTLIYKWTSIVFVLLFSIVSVLIYFGWKEHVRLKSENLRQSKNVEVLNSNYKSYKIAFYGAAKSDSLNAAKITALTYTVSEFKHFSVKDEQTINALNLKLKNVQSVTTSGTQTSSTIKTKIQYVDSVKCLNYSDKFTSVSGCFKGDSIALKVISNDTLTTVVNRIPKHKFLWWSWGVKAIELDITANNPNTKFTYLKYIELK